jgi:dihydroneopterin aldolase
MQNTIFVRNLKISGTHGESSHLVERVFTVDMDIDLKNIDRAIEHDDLKETFDYRRAVSIAKEIIKGSTVHLIETLAYHIATKILKYPKVQKIKLTLTKRESKEDFDSGITISYPASHQYDQ